MSAHLLEFGSERIPYVVTPADTRRLSISVYPDLSVRVRAPLGADHALIESRLQRRAPWILKHLRRFVRLHPLLAPRQYISGETHQYLGRQYRLRIRRGDDAVRLANPFLMVTHRQKDSPRVVRRLLDEWYFSRARAVFPKRLERVLAKSPWLARDEPRLRVRDMTSRWGSCSRAGVITLSIALVKAPPGCIDYVVAHELCHRLELGHTPRFYRLLTRAVPEWESVKERLNRVVR